ncbi:MAG: hypothetical protein L0Z62_34765 [Gemmataceae bacterium]|nr:hypothetical protein [Gemmataceae bacterium]
MRMLSFLTALCFATGAAATASGAELTKIERTIAKEPAYKSHPRYCLLAFGPEAKFRVWLVRDGGDVLYVDRNGNGDLTEPGERVARGAPGSSDFHPGDIIEPDSKVRHTRLEVDAFDHRVGITVAGKLGQRTSGEQGDPGFSHRPQDAPIIHFNRPLTFGLVYPDERVGPLDYIVVEIGTPGLGKGTFAAIEHDAVPRGRAPIAEVLFPNKDPKGKPIKITTLLRGRE